MARHSSPRQTPTFAVSASPGASRGWGVLAGFSGGPALAGVPSGGPAPFGGSGFRAAALPGRPPAGLGPAADRAPTNRPGDDGRRPSGQGPLTGRLAILAVAAGALATAGHSLAGGLDAPTGETRADLALSSAKAAVGPSSSASPIGAGSAAAGAATAGAAGASTADAATTGVMAVSAAADRPAAPQVASLTKARKIADDAAAREAAARAPEFVKPAQGRYTSGFGARWGTSHNGIDLANSIGTPILAAAGGTVIDSGPASGFGMWVRIQLDDGTINVYGHINRSYVEEGQTVKAGQEIAEIGNRGQSTGPHLHFEVVTPGGTKINPQPWLQERGVSLGAQQD